MWTHTGYVKGNDARCPAGYQRKIELRETKTLWIGRDGSKWSKGSGRKAPREAWPMYRLDISTIQPISA